MRSPLTGIDRDGHRTLNTVTGDVPGQRRISRQHDPDCPCTARAALSARVTRRRKPTRR